LETVRLTEENRQEAVARASAVLGSGGVILYPTDTLYGLGADAFSDEAVAKVYSIKGRDEKKPIHCIVLDIQTAQRYTEVNDLARKLAEKFLPGPLTLVLKKSAQGRSALGGKSQVDSGIGRDTYTIGIRIPQNEFCLELARTFGPYTTTSANVAGAEGLRSVPEILAQLGEHASMIDLAIDAGELPQRKPSTVVDVSSSEVKILREGAISAAEISQV
jgi:L-threonylcarbamoyladenylate synthase